MIYVLKQGGNIKSFGETPFGLGDGESQEEVDLTMAQFAGRFKLSADKTTIQADGIDEALVTVTTNLFVPSIDVNVNGTPVTVAITNGTGQLDPISAETGGSIVVEPADKSLYCPAGEGLLVIIAEEVE